ncbi:MAG: LOG family protein, partial [Candidatus Taylorbacteria bacterium]|nr:LOG family protein [Candidatus Taylorbacteria bacterium]
EAFVFLPGGYGTLNEFFETITLLQTKKVPKVPVILYGRDFWGPVNDLIHKTLYVGHQSIDKKDMDLYFITDDEGGVIEVIKKAPVIQALEFRLNGNREKS